MNANVEKRIHKLENEISALKAAFAREASSLITFTYSREFSTQKNEITARQQGLDPFTTLGDERVVVTFTTENGANTPAVLELRTDNAYVSSSFGKLVVQRVPYSGGARWIVESVPNDPNNWRTTNYTFVVHSLIRGSLGAKMIWQ